MALITRITNIITNLKYRTALNYADIQDISDINKRQTFDFSTIQELSNPDILDLSTEYSQEIIEEINQNEEESSINFIA